jgi:1-acyl-sn-glycerol-3-phosphate acyltransferase
MNNPDIKKPLNLKKADAILRLLNPRRFYHRAELISESKIPSKGGAVLVSNHGRLSFDFFILLQLILEKTGRLPRIMGDHFWFEITLIKKIALLIGGVEGTRLNAIELINNNELILAYPGGVREIMNSPFGREYVNWQKRYGFAHVAIKTRVSVIPILSLGVNNGLLFLSKGKILGRLLFRYILKLGPAYNDYCNPLAVGIIPIPLPLSISLNFPFPCKLRYIVGNPIYPDGTDEIEFAEYIENEMKIMIAEHRKSKE